MTLPQSGELDSFNPDDDEAIWKESTESETETEANEDYSDFDEEVNSEIDDSDYPTTTNYRFLW